MSLSFILCLFLLYKETYKEGSAELTFLSTQKHRKRGADNMQHLQGALCVVEAVAGRDCPHISAFRVSGSGYTVLVLGLGFRV